MKRLLLIRHAKSGHHPSLSDFDRTLTDSGKSDAAMMAQKTRNQVRKIDAFVSSPAKRAMKTAEIFIKEYKALPGNLIQVPSLYEPAVNDFNECIWKLDDRLDCAAIFSHNPGITAFVNSLDCSPVYNMPTCAVYALEITTLYWKDFSEAEKEFLFFDYPKNES